LLQEVPLGEEQLELPRNELQPSKVISAIMEDYVNGHRTIHNDTEPPYIKIQHYKHKMLLEETHL